MAETKKGRPAKPKELPIVSDVDEAVKDVVVRGRGGINNFGTNVKEMIKTECQREIAKGLLRETLDSYRQPRVTSDEELASRLNAYFERCATEGIIPTVEEMALSTGYSLSTVWDWENERNKGFSPNTSEIIKKSKSFLQTFDAKLVTSGQLNFLTYCFRAKNYYGMIERSEVVVTPSQPLGNEADVQTVADKYLDALPENK